MQASTKQITNTALKLLQRFTSEKLRLKSLNTTDLLQAYSLHEDGLVTLKKGGYRYGRYVAVTEKGQAVLKNKI